VFSVLGQREVDGVSGTVLEGESGANDPVGIALMAALLSAGSLSGGALLDVLGRFGLQLFVGGLVGVVGGRLLIALMRTALPAEGLYPVRTLVAAGVLYGVATIAHGSGLLAVFVAGIVVGDARAPYKREVERFHSALASLAEGVAFALLGLAVDPHVLARTDVWLPGLALGLALAFVVRPGLTWPLLWRMGLTRGEQAFVLLSGLKGAVPLLLGSLLLPLEHGERLFGVVTVVVLVSVAVQGSLVPVLARRCGVRMRTVPQEPFTVGLRTRHEPQGAFRVTVESGSPAEGSTVAQLPGLAEGTWVSLVLRDGALVPVRAETLLREGDDVLVLLDADGDTSAVHAAFRRP
jgi:cell volume regulation protein A